MFQELCPNLKSVIATIGFHSEPSSIIYVGSFADLIHYYGKAGYHIIKPNDLDIITPNIESFGILRKLINFHGPFQDNVYSKLRQHQQYYFYFFGLRVDIYIPNTIEDFQNIDTTTIDFYSHKIAISSEKESMGMHLKCMDIFQNPKDSAQLDRLKKHSKRYSFYTMLNENIL
jgi:hypothetical protein